jgi:hypothetical protein
MDISRHTDNRRVWEGLGAPIGAYIDADPASTAIISQLKSSIQGAGPKLARLRRPNSNSESVTCARQMGGRISS